MLHLTGTIFCPGCVRPGRLEDHLEAAAAAGFSGLSLWSNVYTEARGRGLADTDITALLERHGITVEVLEAMTDWASSTDTGAVRERAEWFCSTAVALGAGVLCAAAMEPALGDPGHAARHFALICDIAADHGIRVALEPLAFGAIDHYRLALEIVERAGRDNGGFLVDSWHWFRTGGDAALLRALPGERIFNIQLNDAPARAEADAVAETMHRRRLPGAGDIDYQTFFAALAALEVRCAIGPEVFSDELQNRDRVAAARVLKASLDEVLARPAIAALCSR